MGWKEAYKLFPKAVVEKLKEIFGDENEYDIEVEECSLEELGDVFVETVLDPNAGLMGYYDYEKYFVGDWAIFHVWVVGSGEDSVYIVHSNRVNDEIKCWKVY